MQRLFVLFGHVRREVSHESRRRGTRHEFPEEGGGTVCVALCLLPISPASRRRTSACRGAQSALTHPRPARIDRAPLRLRNASTRFRE